MPRYDYRCSQRHVTEAVREMAVTEIVCPCGQPALRQAIYASQTIIGETVAKPRLGNPSRDKAGRFRLDQFVEAQSEIIHDCNKAGVESPDLLAHSKEKVRRITATA